jgi:hypothetical protein
LSCFALHCLLEEITGGGAVDNTFRMLIAEMSYIKALVKFCAPKAHGTAWERRTHPINPSSAKPRRGRGGNKEGGGNEANICRLLRSFSNTWLVQAIESYLVLVQSCAGNDRKWDADTDKAYPTLLRRRSTQSLPLFFRLLPSQLDWEKPRLRDCGLFALAGPWTKQPGSSVLTSLNVQ